MRITALCKVNIFSIGKESYEPTLIYAKKREKIYVIVLFRLIPNFFGKIIKTFKTKQC